MRIDQDTDMKQIFILGVLIIVAIFWVQPIRSGERALSGVIALKDLRRLVAISEDLSDATTVMLSGRFQPDSKEPEHCVCTCRDDFWSCTELGCNLQNKGCEAGGGYR